MSFAETDEEREARYTDQMEKDGKRIRELEAEARTREERVLGLERLVANLESKLVQAGGGFPS